MRETKGVPTKLIDIHPHIISSDTARYPVAPLGGKRSEWSSHRPVDFEALVARDRKSVV